MTDEWTIKDKSEIVWDWLCKVIEAVRTHISHLSEVPDLISIFFDKEILLKDSARELLNADNSKRVLKLWLEKIIKSESLSMETFQNLAKEIQKESGIKGKDLYMPLRAALTGDLSGPELVHIIPLFKKEIYIKRIEQIVNK